MFSARRSQLTSTTTIWLLLFFSVNLLLVLTQEISLYSKNMGIFSSLYLTHSTDWILDPGDSQVSGDSSKDMIIDLIILIEEIDGSRCWLKISPTFACYGKCLVLTRDIYLIKVTATSVNISPGETDSSTCTIWKEKPPSEVNPRCLTITELCQNVYNVWVWPLFDWFLASPTRGLGWVSWSD